MKQACPILATLVITCVAVACGGGNDSVCTPQQKSCNGNDIVKCNAAGTAWEFYKACSDGCTDGDCGSGSSCVPACDGKQCGSDGCGGVCGECAEEKAYCNSGVCSDKCLSDEGCTQPGLTVCEGETSLRTCKQVVSGCYKWGEPKSCEEGFVCKNGGCMSATGQCGDNVPVVVGVVKNSVADMSFTDEEVAVGLEHKLDIDEWEDGCISRYQISFSKMGLGCKFSLVVSTAPNGEMNVQSATLSADSFCPGWSDADEGEYVLDSAEMAVCSSAAVADYMSESACIPGATLTFSGTLKLHRTSDGRKLDVDLSALKIQGDLTSTGNTQVPCPDFCGSAECGTGICGVKCGDCACGEDCLVGLCSFTACDGSECGPDGCGASCGQCTGCESECSAEDLCLPQLEVDKGCFFNDTYWKDSCGNWGEKSTECGEAGCSAGGKVCNGCEGICAGKECGTVDGCDCGQCGAGTSCQGNLCKVVCGDDQCGTGEDQCNCAKDCDAGCDGCCKGTSCKSGTSNDSCGLGGGKCLSCEVGAACTAGTCECVPNCSGKDCGGDGCGGTCGSCGCGKTCDSGKCVSHNCDDVECGDDGCGGTCGKCGTDKSCSGGKCVCSDPKFVGDDCNECADPHFAPPGCTSCLPKFTGANCDACADPKFKGPDCCDCADSKFTGLNCDQCSNPHYGAPECTKCLPNWNGASCQCQDISCPQGYGKYQCSECETKCGHETAGWSWWACCDSGAMCYDAPFVDCTPNCSGKQCGSDGCGGLCGTCSGGKKCSPQFKCVECSG